MMRVRDFFDIKKAKPAAPKETNANLLKMSVTGKFRVSGRGCFLFL